MSTSVRERPDDRQIELGTALNWPPILAALGLGVLVLIAGISLVLLSGTRGAPGEEQAQVAAAPARLAVRLPALPEPRPLPPGPPSRSPAVAVVVSTKTVPATPERVPPPAAVKPERIPAPAAVPAPPPVAVVVANTPAPAIPVKVVETPPPPSFKRRHFYVEDELRLQLYQDAQVVDVEAEKGASAKLVADAPKADAPKAALPKGEQTGTGTATDKSQPSSPPAVLALIARRADLVGLPVRNVADCQADKKEATTIQTRSRELRRVMQSIRRGRTGDSSGEEMLRDADLAKHLDRILSDGAWRDDVGVRLLGQMLQANGYAVRMQLVKALAANKGKNTSAALAQRAVFDLSSEVREEAIKALKDRPRAASRPVLLEALRYPWPVAADHAAEALVALDDRDAVGDLVGLLDKPDPQAPVQNKDKKWVRAELVRVNHLGNCLLCHAPSTGSSDPVRGLVPERGKPLPEVYYESQRGSFVRADVTYLKQDFSVVQPVPEPDKWPRLQRFDYLVRQRELSADEVARLAPARDADTGQLVSYAQREAVLWALRELTGQNVGSRSENWYLLLLDRRLREAL